jgi:hypothetical protein
MTIEEDALIEFQKSLKCLCLKALLQTYFPIGSNTKLTF